jgi:ferredoxin--NADP+ reductase
MHGFLEANPYWDHSNIPMQIYKPKEPHVGKILTVKKIVGEKAVGDVFEIVIDHDGKMPYWEGQSYGVIPPGNFFLQHQERQYLS